MNFLVPAFLAGLAALSVPVLIHMINRERKVVVEFPSLMFLHKIPYRSVRRQKIRHLLLLLLRCLALAIIVAAFARPFFSKPRDATAATTGAREVVIALDRSYSMAYGNRWNRALEETRKVIGEIGAVDRASIILFTTEPNAVTTEPTSDRARLEASIARVKVSDEGTRYVPAIKLGGQILNSSTLPRRELVLISDFQQTGWPKREELALPPGVVLKPVDVGDSASSDAAVIAVSTAREKDSTRSRIGVTARLTNVGSKERTTDAVLEVGGRSVESKRVTIPPKGSAQVVFNPVPVPAAATRGLVRIGKDSLPPNDRFHFTIAGDDAVSVLIIQPADARPNQSLYLRHAFNLGERPKFDVAVKYEGQLSGTDLDGRSLVILNEAAPPGGALGSRIRDMVSAGSGLLIIPGDQSVDRWPAEWRSFIPATVGSLVDRSADINATIASVDYTNPIFEIFSAPRSGDFTAARILRYRSLTPKRDSGVAVIARYDDGSPAMIERPMGAGKVAVWGTTLDARWTDLPTQGGVFLPFVHQLGRHVGRYTDARGWFTAGDAIDFSRHAELTTPVLGKGARAATDSGELILEAPSGEKTRLSVKGTNHLARLKESGFYELRGPKTPVGGGRPIAVNVDPAEADLSHLDPKEMVAAATPVPGQKGESREFMGTPEEQERRQTIWWYLLLGALVLLAVETVMSNRLSRAVSI